MYKLLLLKLILLMITLPILAFSSILIVFGLMQRGSELYNFKPRERETKAKQSQRERETKPQQSQIITTAMTWRLLAEETESGRVYGLFGTDQKTNPYRGDTNIRENLPILCIAKENLPSPRFIETFTTPGGALRRSWSGSRAFLTEPIPGYAITSRSQGDLFCQKAANLKQGKWNGNYRMAEFHDGDKESGWAGWDFWADITDFPTRDYLNGWRYWVAIDDQSANPWDHH